MNTLKRIFLLLVLSTLIAAPGLAQTDITTTTLSAALDAESTTLVVASNSGIAVGDIMVIDKEGMRVRTISGTTITVVRGQGSRTDNHANSALVYHEVPDAFIATDRAGTCTAGSEYPNYEPLINLHTGNSFVCSNSTWYRTELGAAVANGLTLTAATTLISGQCGQTVFIDNATGFAITLPVATLGCSFRFVDATLLTSGNHTIVTNGGDDLIAGGCNELEVDTSDDGPIDANGDTITMVGTVDSLGDMIELYSDGTLWFVTFCQSGLDGGFTIASS